MALNLSEVIDNLVGSCTEELPSTVEDTKPVASKEGLIGRIMVDLMKDNFKRYHDALMVFTGTRYEMIEPNDIRKVVSGFLFKMGVGPAYLSRSVGNIHKMLMDNPFLEEFQPRRNVVYMKNCVLLLGSDGSIVKEDFSPAYMSNIYFQIPYVETAKCPNWEKFLSIVIDDYSAVKVLQEFLGCMFIDKSDYSIEKALFCYGIGSNGKSVVFETLRGLMGTNLTNAGLDQINGKSGEYYTAEIVGKLLAYNSDAEAKDISSGKYKQLISKEPVMVRPIRQSPFESDDWPMFMANINKGLITTDSSDGFWRRNIVIAFNKVFSDNPDARLGEIKADKSFKGSMAGEYPGIFNWILAGRARMFAQKGVFTQSKSIEEMTAEMRNSSTGVYAYLSDMGYVARMPEGSQCEDMSMLTMDIYNEYRQYCTENGYPNAKPRPRFCEDLKNAKFTYSRCLRVGGKVSSGYKFYKIVKTSEEVQEELGVSNVYLDDNGDLFEDLPE